jgi:hypothetical protein
MRFADRSLPRWSELKPLLRPQPFVRNGNPAAGLDDVRWLRGVWPGPLVVKGGSPRTTPGP